MPRLYKDFVTEIGARVRTLRKSRGFSVPYMARRAGMTQTMVLQIEQGRRYSSNVDYSPQLLTYIRIAKVLNVNLGELFRGVQLPD